MNLATLRSQSRRYTKSNSDNYPDATLDEDINRIYGEIQMMKLEAEGYLNTDGDFKVIDLENTTGLTKQDLGYNGEYPFPSDAFTLDEVYIDYGDGHVPAEIINKSDVGKEMFQDEGTYSQTSPKVFVFRDSYFVRPLLTTTTVTDGIKLLINARQKTLVTAITDATAQVLEPTFEANFHNLIPLKVAQDYTLIYAEKHNPLIDRKVSELESQFYSYYQDRTPVVMTFKPVREKFNGTPIRRYTELS